MASHFHFLTLDERRFCHAMAHMVSATEKSAATKFGVKSLEPRHVISNNLTFRQV